MIETGFSIYIGTGYEKNKEIIEKARGAGCKYLFTSLNIPEEKLNKFEEIKKILEYAKDFNIIIDISDSLNCDFKNIMFRIDDGFTLDEIIKISKKNNIVLNMSTITLENLEYLKHKGLDFSKVYGMHNFYPKKYTGLSVDEYFYKNSLAKKYGIKTMAFIAGDVLRGPVYEKLVSIEEIRNDSFLIAALKILELKTDIIFVGDIDLELDNWEKYKKLSQGIIDIHIKDDLNLDGLFSNRIDYSDYVIRFNKHRLKSVKYPKYDRDVIKKGDVLQSNERYLRYEGEIEIAIKDLGVDFKRNIVSRVIDEDIDLLRYIKNKYKINLLVHK